MDAINHIIETQISVCKQLGFDIELCGSYLMNEATVLSDVDFRCFNGNTEQCCQQLQTYHNNKHKYRKYSNLINPKEIICNYKYRILDHNIDITFLPLNYRNLYTELEMYRHQTNQSKVTQLYIYKKSVIQKLLNEANQLQDIKLYKKILKKTKIKYFQIFINLYCQKYQIDPSVINRFMNLNFEGSYGY